MARRRKETLMEPSFEKMLERTFLYPAPMTPVIHRWEIRLKVSLERVLAQPEIVETILRRVDN